MNNKRKARVKGGEVVDDSAKGQREMMEMRMEDDMMAIAKNALPPKLRGSVRQMLFPSESRGSSRVHGFATTDPTSAPYLSMYCRISL